MHLSIITINYNNALGLERTLGSVAEQTYGDIEHIIVDGGSSDDSVGIIREYASRQAFPVIWSSERDKGIYNAMNKGIGKATGDYIQILNSGDMLAAPDVTERMMAAITNLQSTGKRSDFVYGNMIKKDYSSGRIIGKSKQVEYSLRNYYSGTMNHDCCYFHKTLFTTYGLYDESLKIVSDWKWFLQAIGLGQLQPEYVDIDMTVFDASGISETNLELRNLERRQVLERLLPPAILSDYDAHAFEVEQMNRLRRRHLYPLVYFIERVLFKLEKWQILK